MLKRGRMLIVLLAVLLAVGVVPGVGLAHDGSVGGDDGRATPAAVPSERVAGENRLETAVAIAQRSFPSGAGTAYLARADQFADALAAGTLTDGPILLVPSCGDLPGVVADEVERLDPDEVVALGGQAAVCDDLLQDAADGRDTGRVAGPNRYETATAIAERGFADGAEVVYVANGDDSPDAVAGGVLTGGPIVLVPSNGDLLDVVTDEVARLEPDRVVALGGTAAVSDDQLEGTAGGRDTDRLSGATRFATAAEIGRAEFGDEAGSVYLARGDAFADAVAAGSLTDGPVLLVPSCGQIPDEPREYLEQVTTSAVVALGGTAAVCDDLLEDAASLPTEGEQPPVPDVGPGALYVDYFRAGRAALNGVAIDRVDMDTMSWNRLLREEGTSWMEVNGAAREIVFKLGDNIEVRDLDNPNHVTATFPWGYRDGGEFIEPKNVGPIIPDPDGEHFATSSSYDGDDEQLEIMNRDGEMVARMDGEVFGTVEWTPDGDVVTTMGSGDDSAIVLIDRESLFAGDPDPVVLADLGESSGGPRAVSNSGDQLAYSVGDDLYVMPLEPGAQGHQITTAGDEGYDNGIAGAAFSPDDQQIAFVPATERDYDESFLMWVWYGYVHVVDNHRDDPVTVEPGDSHAVRAPNDINDDDLVWSLWNVRWLTED